MPLKISVKCPICSHETEWIYDTDKEELHRGSMGCPGGCTAIQQIRVSEIIDSEAEEYLDEQRLS